MNQIKEYLIKINLPLISPEETPRLRLIWDGFAQLARVYFILVIPLDLSFNQEEFMF